MTLLGAPAGGPRLSAITASLHSGMIHQGQAYSLGAFSDSGTSPSQSVNTGAIDWTDGQWTTEPHLCYLENALGAEEAYLIVGNTADGELTLATSFNLQARYPASPSYRICRANTLGSLFGTDTVSFLTHASASNADNIYAWNGNSWTTYHHNGTSWQSPATAFGGHANNTVVYPDEGLFVLRRAETDLVITLSGTVPDKPQISTVAGGRLTFVSSRYPVGTVLNDLGFHQLPDWLTDASSSNADVVYLWNGATDTWISYWHNGLTWQSPATVFGGNANNDPISAGTALFVLRRSESTPEDAANTHTLPYQLHNP